MFKFFLIVFSAITLIGLFILLLWAEGSHGHFKFRVHRTEDWFAFGVPAIGLAGLTLIVIVKVVINIKKNK